MVNEKRQRASHLRWIPIAEMRVSPKAQREFRKSHAEKFAADFDLEALGFPVVSMRGGHYWIVDGQHRIEALKMIGWSDQSIQCETYENLSEAEEAELFLRRDDRRAIRPFDKFRIGITAERDEETDINRIVMGLGLRVSTDGDEKSLACVGAMHRVYESGGPGVLSRAIRILRDAYSGDGARFRAELVGGMGLVCQRYNGELADDRAVTRLGSMHGGAMELLRVANGIKLKTGHRKDDCVAAAVVDAVNGGRGGQKLPSWWA